MLIAAGAHINERDATEVEPIHIAAANSNDAVVGALIAAGANVNAVSRAGKNPFYIACSNPNKRVLELLIAAGAEPRDCVWDSVCHAAASGANDDAMRRVIALKLDVNARSRFGWTPLHVAAKLGSERVVTLLLAAGADVAATDVYGKTPCHNVSQNQNSGGSIMRVLIAAGADVRARSKGGWTPFEFALHWCNVGVLRALVETAGIDIAHEFRSNPALMSHAVQSPTVLQFVFQQRAALLGALDKDGQTACHCADDDALAVLFARGVNLNVPAPNWRVWRSGVTLIAAGVELDPAILSCRTDSALAVAAGFACTSEPPARNVAWMCRRIAARQVELLRLRAFEVCTGLHALDLPALVTCEILAFAFAPHESLVPWHLVWRLATTMKHYASRA